MRWRIRLRCPPRVPPGLPPRCAKGGRIGIRRASTRPEAASDRALRPLSARFAPHLREGSRQACGEPHQTHSRRRGARSGKPSWHPCRARIGGGVPGGAPR